MSNNFNYIAKFKKKNIDMYIFIICNNFKKNIEYISSLIDIEKIPKRMFEDYSLKNSFEKKMYTDNF